MAKGDSVCIHDINNKGTSKTIFVSRHKWLRHKMKHGISDPSPINTKKRTGSRKRSGSKTPEQSRTLTGRSRDRNPKNWREQQKILAKKGTGKVGHHRNETQEERYRRRQKHHDSERWKTGERGRDDRFTIADRLLSKIKGLKGD